MTENQSVHDDFHKKMKKEQKWLFLDAINALIFKKFLLNMLAKLQNVRAASKKEQFMILLHLSKR